MREDEDMNEGNNEKVGDFIVVVVIFVIDWFYKARLVCKFLNRNLFDCEF